MAPGSTIELLFLDFELESDSRCKDDYVRVRDSNFNVLWTGCGTERPAVLRSSSNKMAIFFGANEKLNYRGFLAIWKEKRGFSP